VDRVAKLKNIGTAAVIANLYLCRNVVNRLFGQGVKWGVQFQETGDLNLFCMHD